MNFVVYNQKGGTGKSTTVSALSACLAEMGHEVLAVDMTVQANLTWWLSADDAEHTTVDMMRGDQVSPTTPFDELPGLSVLPSDQGIAQYREKMPPQTIGDWLDGRDETYTIIDLDPAPNAIAKQALSCADVVLAPTGPSSADMQGLSLLQRSMEWVRERNAEAKLRVLLTRADRRTNETENAIGDLRRTFGHKLLDSIIYHTVRLSESHRHQQPINLYAPNSKGATYYRELAEEIEEI